MCAFAVCYSGPLELADEVLQPIRALGAPIADLLADQPYTQLQSYLDESEPKGMHYYWRTAYVSELSDELLATARELFADCVIPDAEVGFLHIGGALNELAEDDGAVGNRDARYVLGSNGMWSPDEPRAAAFKAWVRAAGDRQRPFSTGRTYINFQTADEPEERVAGPTAPTSAGWPPPRTATTRETCTG